MDEIGPHAHSESSALGRSQRHHPRRFEDFRYAYAVISRRSGGVSIGVNLNLDKICNFACPYCQVDRRQPGLPQILDLPQLTQEVEALLDSFDAEGICRLPRFAAVPDAQKRLHDVALSGDGEPTMVPEFESLCQALAEIQGRRAHPGFQLILITNATLLDREPVLRGIDHLLSQSGEVWAKLDAGTEAYFQRINISRLSLDRIEANLKKLGSRHPFTVQSFFCRIDGEAPSATEISAYVERLRRIQESGARLKAVQLYSLARPPAEALCSPLEVPALEAIAASVRALGLSAQVFATAD